MLGGRVAAAATRPLPVPLRLAALAACLAVLAAVLVAAHEYGGRPRGRGRRR
ncbi:hypothetical protein [Kitasatospora sp. NBC_00458]|uniref:hypothetical protein n=1 Tax=Kitasatospora sp. NBC_00458 TaxID=2903568 RepID=UPI002E16ECBC